MYDPKLYYPGDVVLMSPHVVFDGAEHIGVLVPIDAWNQLATGKTHKCYAKSLQNNARPSGDTEAYGLRGLVFGDSFCSTSTIYSYSFSPPNVKRLGSIFVAGELQHIWTLSRVFCSHVANALPRIEDIINFVHCQGGRERPNGFQIEHMVTLEALVKAKALTPRPDGYYRVGQLAT